MPEAAGDGLQSTLQITVVSGVLALPLGVVLALLRLSHRAAIRWIATTHIEMGQTEAALVVGLTRARRSGKWCSRRPSG